MTSLLRSRGSAARTLSALVLAGLTALTASCSSDSESDSGSDSTASASSATRTVTVGEDTVEIPADPQSVVACGYAVLPLIQADANLSGVCEWTREIDNM